MAVDPSHNEEMAHLTISIVFAIVILWYVIWGGKDDDNGEEG